MATHGGHGSEVSRQGTTRHGVAGSAGLGDSGQYEPKRDAAGRTRPGKVLKGEGNAEQDLT
jgi:hypothetical protein